MKPAYDLLVVGAGFAGAVLAERRLDPKELDPAVCGRIPIRINRDNRYLTKRFQALPQEGYAPLFQRLLDHPNIEVRLGVNFQKSGFRYHLQAIDLYGAGGRLQQLSFRPILASVASVPFFDPYAWARTRPASSPQQVAPQMPFRRSSHSP